jgi:hypothetical protein
LINVVRNTVLVAAFVLARQRWIRARSDLWRRWRAAFGRHGPFGGDRADS